MTKQIVVSCNPLIKRAICSICSGDRNCDVFGDFDDRGSDGYSDWSTHWYLMKCRGCDHVFVQRVSTSSEDRDDYYDENGDHITDYFETISYFPAQSKRERPDWINLIRVENKNTFPLINVLNELYLALDNDLHVLASIGMRTAFDAASEILGIDSNFPFQKKLQALVASGHIEQADISRLEVLVDVGNASAHRGWKAGPDEISTVMDVLEHFLNEAFVSSKKRQILDSKAQNIGKNVPAKGG